MSTLDLNCDMGESFGAYRIGDDAAMMDLINSANIACGFHAGDPVVMRDTILAAKARGVSIGAHPSFMADHPRQGTRCAREHGRRGCRARRRLRKGHQGRRSRAGAHHASRSQAMRAAEGAGLSVACEVYADRRYDDNGMLASRQLEGAVIHDLRQSVDQVLSMVVGRRIPTIGGKQLPVEAATVCIHGDTPGAVGVARALRQALNAEGIEFAAFKKPNLQ